MSIPKVQDLRAALNAAASDLGHPYKGVYTYGANLGRPHKYGRLVYADGGHVGGLFDGRYLIARGDDAEDSILALAHAVGLTSLDNGVTVDEVDAGWFWLHCNPTGRMG